MKAKAKKVVETDETISLELRTKIFFGGDSNEDNLHSVYLKNTKLLQE